MAMTKCKECKKDVSTSAKVCPHCGVKNPGVKTWQGFIVLAVIIAIGWFFIGGDSKESDDKAAAKACTQTDGECLFKANLVDAVIGCKPLIEKNAKYEYEFTDGITAPFFVSYKLDSKKSQLTYFGDEVKFSNAFNAKSKMIYACTFDLKAKRISNLKMETGSL